MRKKLSAKNKQQTKTRKSSANKNQNVQRPERTRRGSMIEMPAIIENESDDTLTETAGQAGDIEGLTSIAIDGPESVRELAEEGQDFEAELVDGIENAPVADKPLKVHRRKADKNQA
jgi:hypothetical protein